MGECGLSLRQDEVEAPQVSEQVPVCSRIQKRPNLYPELQSSPGGGRLSVQVGEMRLAGRESNWPRARLMKQTNKKNSPRTGLPFPAERKPSKATTSSHQPMTFLITVT